MVTGGAGMPGGLGGFGGYVGAGSKGGYKGNLSMLDLAGNNNDSCNLKWEANPGVDRKRGLDGLDMQNGECGRNGVYVGYMDRDTWDIVVTYTGTLKIKQLKSCLVSEIAKVERN